MNQDSSLGYASDRIYDALRKSGPHCASELSILTGVSLKQVSEILLRLEAEGLIERNTTEDPGRGLEYEEEQRPWQLKRRGQWLASLLRRAVATTS